MSKIVLVDGNSLMFRAYYATAYNPSQMMKTSNGLYTNAVYTFIILLNKILEIENMTNLFVAFDKGKKTLRHQEYDDYKGTRRKMPEEFAMQIPYIKEYLDIMNIARLELDEYEADDIVGTLANKTKTTFDEVLVITSDRDLLQLVKDNITVCLTKKGFSELDYYTKDNFYEKLGFNANQLIDYKALTGDSSDNLPGIPKVGEKTAIKLLNQFSTLEEMYENIDKLPAKLIDNFKNYETSARRTKHLATIYTDANFSFEIEKTILQEPIYDDLRAFYEKLELHSFIKRMKTSNSNIETSGIKQAEINIKYHYNELDKKFLDTLKECSLELELTKENYHKADIIGFSITNQTDGYYFDYEYLQNQTIKQILEDENIKKYCLDSKKIIYVLNKENIAIKGISFDLILAAYICDPSLGQKDYHMIIQKFKENDLPYQEEIYGKKDPYQITDIEKLQQYSIKKGIYTFIIKDLVTERLQKEETIFLLNEVEMPLAKVLAKVELNGFKVNRQRLEELGLIFNNKLKELEKAIYEMAGHPFNISSPKQLGVILFEEMCLAKGKKNKTGYSTTAEILEKLAKNHPFPKMILDYRKYSKLITTYVNGLESEIEEQTSKVHTTFKQALTLTGRLSSVEPNIQNIPIRTEEGRLIRSAFVPSTTDGLLISADYSQIELRVLASMSNCKNMQDEFNSGLDLHSATASRIYGVDISEVTKEMRRTAKAVNFGIVYGMSNWGLSEELNISVYDATTFIERYFEAYPEIKTYLESVVENATTNGYTTTLYKRRRYIPEINNANVNLKEFGKRTAKNAPIQGTAADIMKIAMIKVDKIFTQKNLKAKIVAQVHDELIIDTPQDEVEIVKKILKETFENAVKLNVKLESSVEAASTWDLK